MKKYFVHKFKYSHESKRRKFKKWLKLGYVEIVERQSDGWLYQSEFNITTVFHRKQSPTFEIEF